MKLFFVYGELERNKKRGLGLILKYYADAYVQRLTKTTNNLNQA
jgi:hypothetical protein